MEIVTSLWGILHGKIPASIRLCQVMQFRTLSILNTLNGSRVRMKAFLCVRVCVSVCVCVCVCVSAYILVIQLSHFANLTLRRIA